MGNGQPVFSDKRASVTPNPAHPAGRDQEMRPSASGRDLIAFFFFK
jgi:hypothetical protein